MWVYPLLLSVPGIALCFTEHYTAAASVANAALPLGVYLLLCAWSRKVGRTVLLCTPLSIYAAFQIVLLFLYGESIVAVPTWARPYSWSWCCMCHLSCGPSG